MTTSNLSFTSIDYKMFNKLLINSSLIWISLIILGFVLNGRVVESVVQQTYGQGFRQLSSGSESADHCYRNSRCQQMNSSQCLDVTLPYKFTTNTLWENQTFHEIHYYLNRWKGLRSIPQCWKALQSVLCATFFPRCENESSRVSLPTHDMCRLMRHPCRLIEQHHHWPEFLRCDNTTLFPNKCKNEYTDLKFNTSGIGAKCSAPLVQTDDQNIWYPGIEGCALQCLNPIYTSEEHRKVRSFVSHGAGISLVATLFSVLTFIIDWRSSNRYPAVIIFYLNMCLMISSTGWLLGSALTKGHNEIVCRPDNTSRYAEPGNSPENFYCLTVFLLIYYFSMAALVWFVNLAYAWDMSFQITGVAHRDSVDSKVAYFHLTAWSVPLMLTISILALGEVDGDSLRGICFVGVLKPVMRICFVMVPTTVSLIIGCYYMFRAMYRLIKVKLMNKTQSNSNRKKSKKIEHMIIRIGLFVLFAIIAVTITYASHIYELVNYSHWKKSLDDYIICTLNITAIDPNSTDDLLSESSEVHSCKLAERPNLMYAYLQLLAVFGAGIFASSWVWTLNTFSGWKRFIVRHLKPDSNEPISLKRHEMISKVFRRRHQLSQGCYSPSFHSMHSDPVGMNLNSAVSQDLSATWAAALPNFVYRRGAIVGSDPNSQTNHYLPTFVGTRHSSNSDVSQQRSYDSYRRSLDSQYSLEQLEMAVIDRHQRRKTKKEREKLLKAHKRSKPYPISRRRGSDTSGSIISAAMAIRGFGKGAKSECKSTSTGDLMQLANHHHIPPMIAPNATFINTPIASPSVIPMPFVPPQNIVPRPRLIRPTVANYTFTHGMTDQSSHLTNPLLERRRPDSCLPTAHLDTRNLGTGHMIQPQNTTPNGTLIQNNTNSNPNIQLGMNFGMPFPMNNLNTTNLSTGLNYMASAQPLNYFQHSMNSYYGNLMANNQFNSFGANFMTPAYPTTPLPNMPFPSQYPPYPQYPQMAQPQVPQQPQLQDIQALMREREAYLQLIRPMDSASEADDNFLPIQLSDSEGLYSPDLQSRNEGLITAQELVDAHIQKVEARLEASNGHNQTVVGALGDGSVGQVIEVQSPKSKSESKRKKKKSSKKQNKTNGSVVNNNNNNNKCIELEEQKPLMAKELNTNEEKNS